MAEEIKVSIVCVAYNHGNYIEQTIKSFLMQKTTFKFEVIIHDDASTDGTADIIRRYRDFYPDIIKPIFQTENQYSKKVPIYYKYLYPNAKGKYIAICEGDDFWIDENKIQRQVEFLENHEEYIACVHKYMVVDKYGKEQDIKTFGYYDESEAGRYTLSDFNNVLLPSQMSSLMMRNILQDKERGYPESFVNIAVQGDIKLFLYLLAQGDIYRMPQIMSAYRFVYEVGGGSWSSSTVGKRWKYKQWVELRKLEQTFTEEYVKDLNISNREINAALDVMREIKKAHAWTELYRCPMIFLKQKGLLKAIVARIMEKFL